MINRYLNSNNLIKNTFLILAILAFSPKAYFHLANHSDSAIRFTQNLVFNQLTNGQIVQNFIPHGHLSFLQYPLGVSWNYIIFFLFYFAVNILIIKSIPTHSTQEKLSLFIIIQLAIGQRFLPIVLFFLLINNKKSWSLVLCSILVGLYLNIRLSLGIGILFLWVLKLGIEIAFSKPKDRVSKLKLSSLSLLIIYAFATSFYYGNPLKYIEYISLILTNSEYSLSTTGSFYNFIPSLLLFIVFQIYYWTNWRGQRVCIKFVESIGIILFAVYYIHTRPDPGTIYVGTVLFLAFIFSQVEIDKLIVKYGLFSLLIFGLLILESIWLTNSFKLSRFDPIHSWKTLYSEVNKSIAGSNAVKINSNTQVFPWAQQLYWQSKEESPSLGPHQISYTSQSYELDSMAAMSLKSTLYCHKANFNGAKYQGNDINGFYLPFSNAFVLSAILNQFEAGKKEGEFYKYIKRNKEVFKLPNRIHFPMQELVQGLARNKWYKAKHINLIAIEQDFNYKGAISLELFLGNGEKILKPVSLACLKKGIYVDYFIEGADYFQRSLPIEKIKLQLH
ncbi:hypothetical protein [Croceimicrobium sp.]|uniref:hypothetical protein n=1 Tax=Croceimicrobium sp. TaxID=2828340 RepID=UPI003BA90F72